MNPQMQLYLVKNSNPSTSLINYLYIYIDGFLGQPLTLAIDRGLQKQSPRREGVGFRVERWHRFDFQKTCLGNQHFAEIAVCQKRKHRAQRKHKNYGHCEYQCCSKDNGGNQVPQHSANGIHPKKTHSFALTVQNVYKTIAFEKCLQT